MAVSFAKQSSASSAVGGETIPQRLLKLFTGFRTSKSESYYTRGSYAYTNAQGNFTISKNLFSGRGTISFWSGVTTHFYDLGIIRVYSPINGTSAQRDVWILAWQS